MGIFCNIFFIIFFTREADGLVFVMGYVWGMCVFFNRYGFQAGFLIGMSFVCLFVFRMVCWAFILKPNTIDNSDVVHLIFVLFSRT